MPTQISEKEKAYQKAYYLRTKKKCIDMYGGCCACCGEDTLAFLTIDHIDGSGATHRRQLSPKNTARPGGGGAVYRDLLKKPKQSNIQVLCFNCNSARGQFGICPHQQLLTKMFWGGIV